LELKITDLLAVYGALLSSFVFLWNISKTKRKISVKITHGMEGNDENLRGGIYVFIQNPSTQVAHISGISILAPWRKTNLINIIIESIKYRRWFSTYGWVHSSLCLYEIEDGCPVSIEPGHSHRIFIPENVITEILKNATAKEIMASVQDQLWNETCSKPFRI
tara:strand:+ start:78 stop:566 length:489 start_codon:yes stop_codon:yes gene_type:complete